jgi:hypothetical protein
MSVATFSNAMKILYEALGSTDAMADTEILWAATVRIRELEGFKQGVEKILHAKALAELTGVNKSSLDKSK